MDDIILDSVKDKIAGGSIHEHFDQELIDAINAAFVDLRQIGIGPADGFALSDGYETWSSFLGENQSMQESVKTLVALKVRLMFDPPTNASVKEAIEKTVDRLEWRLNVNYEIGV